MEERHHYRAGLVWPVVLIGAGVVFLLNNLGVIGWDVWRTLLQLWPVLLIAIGLDILIGRRSLLGSGLVALLLVGVLVAAILLGGPIWNTGGSSVARTERLSEDLKGNTSATVELRFGTGSLTVGALSEGSDKLVEGELDLGENERLERSYSGSNGKARLRVESRNSTVVGTNFSIDEDKTWDISLNRDVPVDLNIGTGVGKSVLDLSQLNLAGLTVNGGVGQASVKLPARGRYEVEIDGGVGDITLMLPEGLAARIEVDGGLGGMDVRGDFNRSGNDYVSPNFNSAQDRVEINIDGGIGRIAVRELTE